MGYEKVCVLIIITAIFLSNAFKEADSAPPAQRPRIIYHVRNGRHKRGIVIRPGYNGNLNAIQATFDVEVGLGEASFMNFHK